VFAALLETAGGLDVGGLLLDILIVLVAAKAAAEIAERVGVPAVLGEILAGVLIGPSVLGLVVPSDVLFMLGEIGVILLLLNVGMEMDLAELGKVGRASLTVAVIGVIAPFATGALAGVALGQDTRTAIFLGAALTATSVGITARVFGDMRALATTEARVVLGAAVADDVLGLIILTVVVGAVEKGSISVGAVLGIVGLAALFLIVAGGACIIAAPKVFDAVQRRSRSSATLTALAFVTALGLSVLADVAHLAPIIGAFIAGLAMGRTRQSERIESDLSSLGHIFIPIFFLQIGIDSDVASLVRPKVLALAGALLVVAIVGKLIAGYGTGSLKADRLLIGIGMIPRGEVGLIFATLGLRSGVLDNDMYAALLLVVLVTTMITPPLLRLRAAKTAPTAAALDDLDDSRPLGGWAAAATARQQAAQRLAASSAIADRIEHAPRAFLLAHEPDEIARLAQLVEPAPDGDAVRVAVSPHPDPTRWSIDIACRDRVGLLARLTTGLADHGHEILSATCSTWADDAVVDSFVVHSAERPAARDIALALEAALREAAPIPAVIDGAVSFSEPTSSWLTHCTIVGPIDEPLLQAASAACALLGIEVHDAHFTSGVDGLRLRLSLSDHAGNRLTEAQQADLTRHLSQRGAGRPVAHDY
jgi:Kef-type K+ transport system membrane component KefB